MSMHVRAYTHRGVGASLAPQPRLLREKGALTSGNTRRDYEKASPGVGTTVPASPGSPA
jgi:hypothetical protein